MRFHCFGTQIYCFGPLQPGGLVPQCGMRPPGFVWNDYSLFWIWSEKSMFWRAFSQVWNANSLFWRALGPSWLAPEPRKIEVQTPSFPKLHPLLQPTELIPTNFELCHGCHDRCPRSRELCRRGDPQEARCDPGRIRQSPEADR